MTTAMKTTDALATLTLGLRSLPADCDVLVGTSVLVPVARMLRQLLVSLVMLLCLWPGSHLASAQQPIAVTDSTTGTAPQATGPVIWTDKTDYSPGTLAVFSGSGFQAGETISLQVVHADGRPDTGDDHGQWTTVADATGAFQTQWHVCEDDCLGSTLLATANGLTSGLTAKALFTDSATTVAYLRSVVGRPWSVTTNEAAMDQVFGAGNWLDLRYETVNAGTCCLRALLNFHGRRRQECQ